MVNLKELEIAQAEVQTFVDKEAQAENTPVIRANTKEEVAEIVDEKGDKPFAVLTFARTESNWWHELVGAHNTHTMFLSGRPKGSSIGLAVIVFNAPENEPTEVVKEVIKEVPSRTEIPEAPVSIRKLLNMGMSLNGISAELETNAMLIKRLLEDTNANYERRVRVNAELHNLVTQKQEEMKQVPSHD